jgi:hypothetical protein
MALSPELGYYAARLRHCRVEFFGGGYELANARGASAGVCRQNRDRCAMVIMPFHDAAMARTGG